MTADLAAFGDADFNWVRPLESVWKDPEFDVPDRNSAVVEGIADEFFRKTRTSAAAAIGQIVMGNAGIGKTHMVGRLRKRVWEGNGWFVLLDIVGLKDFWQSAALCFANSLAQRMADGRSQGEAVLSGVARLLNVEDQVRAALRFPGNQSLNIVDMLLTNGLDKLDRLKRLQHQEAFRALYLFCCRDPEASNLAYSWLQGMEIDPDKGRELGFATWQRPPVDLVRGLSWIMSLAGPTLVAVDQIDGLVSPSSLAAGRGNGDRDDAEPTLVDILAAGLMELHEVRQRGMTVVTCLERTWSLIADRALLAATQRFARPKLLLAMADPDSVGRLIAGRLAPAYAEAGFAPPYPAWPFSPAAVAGAAALLPRQILMRCEEHRRVCVDEARVTVCEALVPGASTGPPGPVPPTSSRFEDAYARARAVADAAPYLDAVDDSAMGGLLRDTLGLYVRQIGPSDAIDVENRSDPAQKKPPLHGRLTFTDHDENERERHFCFRAIEHANAIAFQSRLGAAMTASGIDRRLADRHLFLVRRAPMPGGAKTAQLVARFGEAGGIVIVPSDEDLRTFVALRSLRDDASRDGVADAYEAWLRARRPLDGAAFFRTAGLCPPPMPGAARTVSAPSPETPALATASPAPRAGGATAKRAPLADVPPASERDRKAPGPPPPLAPVPVPAAATTARVIPVGHRIGVGHEPVLLPAALLARHTAIIGGTGSGKTVLLRRLVEEAALLGIPSIVLDPNNDLARLGDPWPERPGAFTDDDDGKARRYRDTVDVVVWTPGLQAGRPLSLGVLPNFAALGADPDERDQAVGMALATLAPLAGVAGGKTLLKQGVLTDALHAFAGRGGSDLKAFIALLADLPEDASDIDGAGKLAADLANNLRAASSMNPLLRAEGEALDPETLFRGAGGRTRVSVVNLAGLASDAAKHDFVNRLQMTLFSWIKANPSSTGRLYAIDEAQDFVPAQIMTPCRGSAVRLAAQGRKYGLGMVLATQMPRGIDNRIVSNCTTHFFGKQSAPASIDAVKEMVGAKGGRADDIGKLATGEFYFSTEGVPKPVKLRAPLCLTHHPLNPLTPGAVLATAGAGPPSAGSA